MGKRTVTEFKDKNNVVYEVKDAQSRDDIFSIENSLVPVLTQFSQLVPHLVFDTPSHNGEATVSALNTAIGALSNFCIITTSLSHSTLSNPATYVKKESSYSSYVILDAGYNLSSITVMMGMTDITSTAYNNGLISIPSVTGSITITVTTNVLVGITASLNLGNDIIRTSNVINDLKAYLTVTGEYDDSTTAPLPPNEYTLSGTIGLNQNEHDVSTQTITVSSNGFSDTFDVRVYNAMTQNKQSLPEGFTQIAMLWTNKDSYIDTGVLGSLVDHVEYGIQIRAGIGNNTNYHILSANKTWYPFPRQGSTGARNFQGKNRSSNSAATAIELEWTENTNYVIQAYPDVIINGVNVATVPPSTAVDQTNIYIFARPSLDSAGNLTINNLSKARCFYVKMYNDQNELIHYFIPCTDDTNNPGVYDVIDERFFGSSGENSVHAGGAVT